jgi:hypothetical protein
MKTTIVLTLVLFPLILSLCAFSYSLGKLRGIKTTRQIISRQNHPSYIWDVSAGTKYAKVTINGTEVK